MEKGWFFASPRLPNPALGSGSEVRESKREDGSGIFTSRSSWRSRRLLRRKASASWRLWRQTPNSDTYLAFPASEDPASSNDPISGEQHPGLAGGHRELRVPET